MKIYLLTFGELSERTNAELKNSEREANAGADRERFFRARRGLFAGSSVVFSRSGSWYIAFSLKVKNDYRKKNATDPGGIAWK